MTSASAEPTARVFSSIGVSRYFGHGGVGFGAYGIGFGLAFGLLDGGVGGKSGKAYAALSGIPLRHPQT